MIRNGANSLLETIALPFLLLLSVSSLGVTLSFAQETVASQDF